MVVAVERDTRALDRLGNLAEVLDAGVEGPAARCHLGSLRPRLPPRPPRLGRCRAGALRAARYRHRPRAGRLSRQPHRPHRPLVPGRVAEPRRDRRSLRGARPRRGGSRPRSHRYSRCAAARGVADPRCRAAAGAGRSRSTPTLPSEPRWRCCLRPRWRGPWPRSCRAGRSAELPRAHLDSVIMLSNSMWEPVLEMPATHRR